MHLAVIRLWLSDFASDYYCELNTLTTDEKLFVHLGCRTCMSRLKE